MSLPRSLRFLAAQPALTLVATLTLALGLGVNTAIFSLTREVLLRPLPYRDADRLVRVFETNRALGVTSIGGAPANYTAWRDHLDAFETTAAFRRVSFNIALQTTAVQVEGFLTTPGFFAMLGVAPALGRGFIDSDGLPGRDSAVLLTDGFWRRQFGGDAAIVGRAIDVNGRACTVVGVLPPSFRIFHVLNRELDIFVPLVLDPTDREQSISIYAKLKPGVSIDAARAQIAAAYAALPSAGELWSADLMSLSKSFAANARPVLLALQAAVALVLLIACANIANVLLAASSGRMKELAIRQALGASRWRIARDLAGEMIALTVAGGALAALLAAWIVDVLNATVSFQDINRLQAFRIDAIVLLFTAALTLGVTLLFGLLPVRTAGTVDVVDALKESSHGVTAGVSNRRLRHGLIVAELALSIVLAASALALTRSALALSGLPRGLAPEHVMTAQMTFNGERYADTGRLVRLTADMVDRLRAAPGIASAALVNYPPVGLIRVGVPIAIEGQPAPAPDRPVIARYWTASPGYFRTAGIPILSGRDFTAADDGEHAGVAIVSATFARRFWGSTDVIGRRLRTIFPGSRLFWIPRARSGYLTIVGVVGDVREDGLDSSGYPQFYLPYAQNPTIVVTLMAQTTGAPAESALPAIRAAVHAVDPQAPLSYEQSMDATVHETFARPREMAWLVGAFALLALILSAVGVYGVISQLTAARVREIAIRVALGARRSDIVSLVVAQAMTLAAIGVGIGVALAPLALKLAGSLLFGVGPFDPVTLAAVALLLGAVSMAAALIPAVRAAQRSADGLRHI